MYGGTERLFFGSENVQVYSPEYPFLQLTAMLHYLLPHGKR